MRPRSAPALRAGCGHAGEGVGGVLRALSSFPGTAERGRSRCCVSGLICEAGGWVGRSVRWNVQNTCGDHHGRDKVCSRPAAWRLVVCLGATPGSALEPLWACCLDDVGRERPLWQGTCNASNKSKPSSRVCVCVRACTYYVLGGELVHI